MSRRYIHRSGPRMVAALAAFGAVVALGSGLAGCGGADVSSSPRIAPAHAAGSLAKTVPGTAGPSVEQARLSAEILAAWTAAEDAFETAALTANPYEPALAVTTVSPALPHRQAFLETMRTVGDIARGSDDHGRPVVFDITTTSAEVRACERAGEIGVVAATGQPAAGEFGVKDNVLVISSMEWTPGGWKLADETDQPRKCVPA